MRPTTALTQPAIACLVVLALSPIGSAPASGAPGLAVPSAIDAVTVYLDRAVITRTAHDVKLPAGAATVRFEGLPATLIRGSVRASGAGEGAAITGVETRLTHLQLAATAFVDSLEARMRTLEAEEARLTARKNALDAHQEFLKSIRASYPVRIGPQIVSGPVESNELRALAAFLRESSEQAEGERVEIERESARRREEIGRLEAEMEAARGRLEVVTWTASVELDVKRAGGFDLTLEYAVSGASWTPSYDVQASDDLAALEAGYYGSVSQRTGEDWADVAMTLSTATPSVGAQVPELCAWMLAPIRPRVVESAAAELEEAAALKAGVIARAGELHFRGGRAGEELYMADAALPQAKLALSPLAAISGDLSVTFPLTRRQSVPSDGTAKRLLIANVALAPGFSYRAVPKLAPHAYLTAATRNGSEYPLLAGETHVFLGGRYIGDGALQNVAAGEDLTLSLGADGGIEIARDLVKKERREGGSQSRVEYLFRIRVENHRRVPVDIAVSDQVPVSQDRSVEVRDLRIEPKTGDPDEKGSVTWKAKVAAGGRQEFFIGFTVESPKDIPVAGLI